MLQKRLHSVVALVPHLPTVAENVSSPSSTSFSATASAAAALTPLCEATSSSTAAAASISYASAATSTAAAAASSSISSLCAPRKITLLSDIPQPRTITAGRKRKGQIYAEAATVPPVWGRSASMLPLSEREACYTIFNNSPAARRDCVTGTVLGFRSMLTSVAEAGRPKVRATEATKLAAGVVLLAASDIGTGWSGTTHKRLNVKAVFSDGSVRHASNNCIAVLDLISYKRWFGDADVSATD